MRNYVQMFWAKITYQVDVNPPNPPVDEKTFLMDESPDALATFVADTVASLKTNPQVLNVNVENKGGIYWLLDKNNLTLILQDPGFAAMQIFDQTGFWPPYIYSGPNDNPRSGWTDTDDVKRPAQGNEHAPGKQSKAGSNLSGVGGLFAFLNSLPALALLLRREGRIRDAGIVLEQYNQVIAGKESLVELLAIFRQNGIP